MQAMKAEDQKYSQESEPLGLSKNEKAVDVFGALKLCELKKTID